MRCRNRRLFLFSICLFPVTILFTTIVILDVFVPMDQWAGTWFTSWSTPAVIDLMSGVTFLAKTDMLAFFSIITVLWLSIRKSFNLAFLYLMIMGGGVVITFLMKIMIERDRPGEIYYLDLWGFGSNIISYSYPSGHAVKGLLFFGFLIYILFIKLKKNVLRDSFIVLLSIIILLIGIGQLVLDRHYVSDVIGGYLVALTWLTFCIGCIHSCKPHGQVPVT